MTPDETASSATPGAAAEGRLLGARFRAPRFRAQGPVDPPPGQAGSQRSPSGRETLLLLGIALVLAVIKSFLVQAFCPSRSMEPGLQVNDRILVQKVSYWGGGSPQRGDIVVFEDPGGWLSDAETAQPTETCSPRR
ncbi:MAG: S26 family signal peptidase [Nocardioides sp.]